MAERITDKLVRSMEPPSKGNRITYDDAVKGFGIRITAAGMAAFVLNYRNSDGRERRYTIGRYGQRSGDGKWTMAEFTVARAREDAKALVRSIANGADPAGHARDRRQAPTVKELAQHFLDAHVADLRESTRRDYTRWIDAHLIPAIGSLKVASLSEDDVRRVKKRLSSRPTTANRVLAVFSKMLSFAVAEGYRPDRKNPVKGIARFTEDARKRYLSQAEIGRLSGVLSDYEPRNSANIIRFLLLTGARSGEVFKARWDQFDFERATWTKPSAHTKQNREHVVPLSAPALALLEGIRRADQCVWVFPGADGKPITTLKTAWRTICDRAELENVRIHDLRHTYASVLVSGGATLPLIGALLGHSQAATTSRYAHLFDEPLREATERVAAVVDGVARASS